MNTRNAKSPLKGKPLRNPGQSLDEEISKIVEDKVTVWLLMVLITVLLAGLEWYRWASQAPYAPKTYTFVALVFTAIGAWKLAKLRKEIDRLKLGRDGEKAVGQFLDQLREDGYRIFHDIVGDGFNIDHIMIGPTGIYTIETKTFRKPDRKDARIVFDGNRVTKDGLKLDRDPVAQAKAQTGWLSELLKESTGRKAMVFPVILFPGWWVESASHSEIWVLNPKALRSFIQNEDETLTGEEITLFSYHLSRFIRTVEPNE